MNDIVFIKGQGGLGRSLPGEDYISGLLLFSSTLPSGFSSTNRIKRFTSVPDAEAAGIFNTHADETKATGSYLVTATGVDGDGVVLKVNEPFGVVVTIATYVKTSAETTPTLAAAAIAALINAGTLTHGYTATPSTATVNITAKPGLGIFLNTGTPLAATVSGTFTGTITQFTGGVASKQDVWHYHISEFFRAQPKGILYVGIFAVPVSVYTFAEIGTMQRYAEGKLRQIAIYKDAAAYSANDLTTIDVVSKANSSEHMPLSALYAGDLKALSDIGTIADVGLLSANLASSVISQDGAALGNYLFAVTGKSITSLGHALGTVALSKVSENIGWVERFNASNSTELDVLAFANGVLFSDPSVTSNLLTLLDNKRHIFLRKYVGRAGSYYNDGHCAISRASDYAYIENNRTIDKAIRGIYASLLGALGGPLYLQADGTLREDTLQFFISQASIPLDQMVRDSEISAYQVLIDPAQDVLATSELIISVQLVINGVARKITIPIGFTRSIAA